MSRRLLRPACLLALLCLQCAAAARDPFAGYQQQERGTLVEADRLVFNTIFGPIPVKLYREAAPQTTNLLIQLATEQGCKNCHFYRNEAKPWSGTGPPYALLQGVFDLPAIPPLENNIPIKMGHVCMIPETRDFFIAYGDHAEWGQTHTVLGEVANDWLAIDLIISQNYNINKHPTGTEMRMLVQPVQFTLTAQASPPQLNIEQQ